MYVTGLSILGLSKKWAVKEKFEYDITVTDNGLTEQLITKMRIIITDITLCRCLDDITPNGENGIILFRNLR